MAKRTRIIFPIRKEDILKARPEDIICLDSEGDIAELTILDGNEKVLFDGNWQHDINNLQGVQKIQSILNGAKFVVGHALNCDLQRLGEKGFNITRQKSPTS